MRYTLSLILILITVNVFAANEYREKSAKLNKLEKRIAEKDAQIKDLLKQKDLAKKETEKKQYIDQSIVAHKKYIELVKEYNELRKELRYKYPEQGDTTERRYLPIREQSLQEIEEESGMDSLLTRVKNKTLKKYKKFNDENQHITAPANGQAQEAQPANQKLRLEK